MVQSSVCHRVFTTKCYDYKQTATETRLEATDVR